MKKTSNSTAANYLVAKCSQYAVIELKILPRFRGDAAPLVTRSEDRMRREQEQTTPGNHPHPTAHKYVHEYVLYDRIPKTCVDFKNGDMLRLNLVDFNHLC